MQRFSWSQTTYMYVIVLYLYVRWYLPFTVSLRNYITVISKVNEASFFINTPHPLQWLRKWMFFLQHVHTDSWAFFVYHCKVFNDMVVLVLIRRVKRRKKTPQYKPKNYSRKAATTVLKYIKYILVICTRIRLHCIRIHVIISLVCMQSLYWNGW